MDLRAAAIANNAEWCDLICRLHGVPTDASEGWWVARRRPPPLYPDAVTLQEGISPTELTAQMEGGPRCAVKDSFADLDLAGEGFEVLFAATWLYRDPAPPAASPWTILEQPDELAGWSAAHGSPGLFPRQLLDDPAVRILAARRDGRVIGGAIANRSAGVVGVSNVFAIDLDLATAWVDAVTTLARCFPGTPLVGYAHGDELAAAVAARFVTTGPLRVWHRPEAG